MPAISGNSGKVLAGASVISELNEWTLNDDADVKTYNAYAGAGWQRTVAGNRKLTGTLKGFYDPNGPIDATLTNGALVLLRLYENSAKYHQGYGRISGINRGANLGSADPQEWTANFESDGTWTIV